MPITTCHEEYEEYLPQWTMIRDAWEGSHEVKEAGVLYLPQLGGQNEKEYEGYKDRAFWYNATARTIDGLTGAVFRIDPKIDALSIPESWMDDITLTDYDFYEFAKKAFQDVISIGRYGILVEMPEENAAENRPYLTGWPAESIRNWRQQRILGKMRLDQVILFETIEQPAEDGFGVSEVEQYRELRLEISTTGTLLYSQQLYRKQKDSTGKEEWLPYGEKLIPTRRQKPMDFIPFSFVAPTSIAASVEKPPIMDLVDANFDHYRLMADYRHGLHFTGLPTAWVAGFPTDTELRIGSQTAWVSNDPSARAGFLEFTGQGLGPLKEAILDAQRSMAMLGASLLEEQSAQAETFSAVQLRQSGKDSVVVSAAKSLSKALEKSLWTMAWWMGEESPQVSVIINTKVMSPMANPSVITALLQARQAGEISQLTWLQSLESAEILQGRTAEEEQDLIETEGPIAAPDLDKDNQDIPESL